MSTEHSRFDGVAVVAHALGFEVGVDGGERLGGVVREGQGAAVTVEDARARRARAEAMALLGLVQRRRAEARVAVCRLSELVSGVF